MDTEAYFTVIFTGSDENFKASYKLEGLGKIHMPLPEKDAHTGIMYTLQDYIYEAIRRISE